MLTSAQIQNITFNSNTDRHYWITDMSGLGNPPIRMVDYDLPGANFGLFVSALYGKRPFTLGGMIVGDSISDLATRRDAFARAMDILGGEQPISFTLPNGIIKQITAICTGVDFTPTAGDVIANPFQAQFEAAFPFFLSPTINQYQIALPVGGGGTVPLPTVPTGLSGNQGGSISVMNNGNAPFWPTVRIYGPVTNPQLLNKAQNLALQLTITLASGQYIDIDFKRKTIIDNFMTNQYSAKGGDWWYLAPGTSTIAFSAASYSAAALCVISAQDSYLSI